MKVSVTEEDIFFACALALEKEIGEISGVMCEFEVTGKKRRVIFLIDLKGSQHTMKIMPKYKEGMCHTEWIYHYLEERGLWGWQTKTRN